MKKILIVEDNMDIQLLLSCALKLEGYKTSTASNGRAGMEHLCSGDLPDAIILDLRMPDMDGWEFRKLQLSNEAMRDIPVIVVSGEGSIAGSDKLAASAILRKPFSLPDLFQTLRSAVPT